MKKKLILCEGYGAKNPLAGSRRNRTSSQRPYQNNHTPSVRRRRLVVFAFSLCVFMSCTTVSQWGRPKNGVPGVATYNAEEPGLRAAHAELELATRVRVTNLNNNRSVIVTITSRIPTDPYRTIHIGRLAGDNIKMSRTSPTPVIIEVLGRPKYTSNPMFPASN
jgi:rare lipoprotein A